MALPILAVFADLPDPRIDTVNERHELTDILAIALCSVISGRDSFEHIAEYGRCKDAFFRRFFRLHNGAFRPAGECGSDSWWEEADRRTS